jgi:glycosyltransferase involved in cell wall biosynthesis
VGELRRGGVFLYPARAGSGVQTKVQAALGLGLPAVLPPEVAAALGVAAGRDALVCGSPADMGDACARLLADRAERQRLGAAGMALARATFTPERAGSALVAVLEEAIQLRGAGRKAAPAAAGGGAA